MAHTKGPWFAEHLNSQTTDIIHIHNGQRKNGEIASVYRSPFKTEYIDNAKLMAMAPRMKQLLEIWVNLSENLASMPGHHEDHDDILDATERLLKSIE